MTYGLSTICQFANIMRKIQERKRLKEYEAKKVANENEKKRALAEYERALKALDLDNEKLDKLIEETKDGKHDEELIAENAERMVAEAELLANPIVQQKPKQSKKDKKATEQELTRQANKAKAEEKRRKEEFERQSAIAQAHRADQQKKKQQAIARKKREAPIKASQLVLESSL